MGKRRMKSSDEDSLLTNVQETQSSVNERVTTSKVKRIPEIIVFEEPGKRIKTELKEERKTNTKQRFQPERQPTATLSGIDLPSLTREVHEFGSSGLRRRDKKKYEQDKLQRLGIKKRKTKVPYPVGLQLQKQRKEREAKQLELDKAMGNIRKKTAKDRDKKLIKMKRTFGRWVDKPIDLDKNVGQFKKRKGTR